VSQFNPAVQSQQFNPSSILRFNSAVQFIAHLMRLLGSIEVTVGEWSVPPQWVSVMGVIVPLAIAELLWTESK